MKYPIGTLVRFSTKGLPGHECGYEALEGDIGTVVADYYGDSNIIGVRFNECFSIYHGLNGQCEYGYGYWVWGDYLTPIGFNEKDIEDIL